MKRSYGQTGQPASGPSSPYQATGPQGQAAIPPLPSGPPPPPPSSAPNPYAATAYNYSAYSAPQGAASGAQQQPVAHPQYPGYGYGGAAAAAPASPYINYGAQQPAYPQAPTAAYPTGAYPPTPAAPQPGYGQQQPPPPPPGAYGQQQQPGGYGYAPPPTQGYNNVPPPPQQQAYPSYPQQPLNPYATPAYPSGPPPIQQQPAYPGYGAPPPSQPSPLGAPPFKRTRYDSNGGPPPPMQGQGMQGPPPALPPLNAYGRGGGNAGGRGGYNSQSNRGGYGDSSSSHNQNPSRNGPPPSNSHHSQSYGNASPSGSTSSMNSHRGGGSRGNDNNMNMRGGGGARGGRGSGPMMTLPGRAGLPGIPAYPRGGGSGPSSLPSGPSNRSVSSSSSSNRGGRGGDRGGRPVSGLPGRGGAFGGRDHQNSGGRSSGGPTISSYDLPKGPRSSRVSTSGAGGGGLSGGLSAANSREGKKERKWGSKESGGAISTGKEDSRKTLTDFRISGLSIPDLQWDWRAEIVKAVVDVVVEAASSDTVEVSEERPSTPTSETIDLPTSKTPSMPPPSSILPEPKAESEPLSSPAKYDMSIDSIAPPSDDTPAEVKVEEEEEEEQPVKKLSKKQKKAEAASKRAATIAATKAGATLEGETQAESGATEEVVKTGEVVEKVTPIVTTTMKKDGKNKHGRDEDEGGDGLVITEVTAAKKVKPDTDAVVILETTATEAPEETMEDEIPTVAAETSSEIPIATPIEIIKETPLSPLPTFIPTGPAADTGRLPILSSRENSRLRIYFSSPVSPPPAPVPVPSKRGLNSRKERKEKIVVLPSTSASTASVAPTDTPIPNAPAVTEALVEAIEEEVDVDGDPVVGIKEESSDIDGEEIAQDSEGEAEQEEEEEDEEEDEDEISSALLASAPVLLKAEEVEDAEVEVKEEVDDEALSAAGETIGSEGLPVEEESIADAVGSGDTTDVSPTTEVEPDISDAIVKEAAKSPPEPTADRISISYAKNTRRMVLDARVVEKVEIFRAEGKIEMSVLIQDSTAPGDDTLPDEFRVCKGILIEALDAEADDYVVIDRASLELAWRTREQQTVEDSQDVSSVDPLLPPFHHLLDDPSAAALQGEGLVISPGYTQNRITIVAYLDRINPLTEARWVKTGDCDSWVTSLALASNDSKAPVSEWKGKISVSDPEPPPTIQHALETWAASAGASALKVRTEFVTSHMSNIDHVFEILLRLTRGDRVIPSHHASSAQAPSVGVLAASLSAPYADQQTQISLAVLAMLRLSLETAAKAGIPAGEIEKQVGEIVRGIPYHLIFKSLDSMFASWKVSKNQKDKLKEAKEVKEAKEAKEKK